VTSDVIVTFQHICNHYMRWL